MNSNIPIATWALGSTSQRPAESAFTTSTETESVFAPNLRTRVNPADIRPGGKYYSIVKLQIRYEGQEPDDNRYAMGTGWLIAPDLLVTAGHCVYDHQSGFRRAVEVKAYVGYYGKEFVHADPNVQFRRGVQIATTKNWIDSDVNRANDVAFIRVDKPFKNVLPVRWQSTPVQGTLTLGVVGYPADLASATKEQGAEMWEMFAPTQFDLREASSDMLEYQIFTYPGQCGAPVLLQGSSELTSIGAHVYGHGDLKSASVIGGQYGNDFGAYISTFDSSKQFKTITMVAGVTYLDVPPQSQEDKIGEQAEGFDKTPEKAIDVAPEAGFVNSLSAGPFLGPIGGPIGGAIGGAIGVLRPPANELSKPKDTGDESGFDPFPGGNRRAVIGEDTL